MNTSPAYYEFGPSSTAVVRVALRSVAPEALERALVRKYLRTLGAKLPVRTNVALLGIFNDKSATAVAADQALGGVELSALDNLVKAFELLVPAPEQGGGPGSIFTPGWVAQWLAEEAITPARADEKVVDPSCGCGALLVAALRRIHGLHKGARSASDIIAHQIVGGDVDESGIRRVKLLLALVALELGDDVPELRFDLRVGDSLDPQQWTTDGVPDTFGVVIGNPPYVRYQELPEAARASLRANWGVLSHGNFNLYYAFFELAQRLRAKGGAVAYIAPNAYFRAASAKPLREWMLREGLPTKVVDFGGTQVFEGAMTYTALTFFDPAPRSRGLRYVEWTDVSNRPKPSDFTTFQFSELDGGPWRLVGKPDRANITNAQSGGRPLLEVADVRFGVATLRDSLYLLDGARGKATRKLVKRLAGHAEPYLIEESATRLAVRVSEVATQEELDNCRTRIIYPYQTQSGRAVVWSQSELLAHPGAHAYLKDIADELAKRDHGKKVYADWFAYGRTQGLAPWTGERLLTPLYASRPRFLRDATPNRVFLNGCAVTPKPDSGVSIELLEVLLNSAVLHYFIERTSSPITGGFFSYMKGPLSSFHIHNAAIARAAELLATSGRERQLLIAAIYGVDLPEAYLPQ